MVYYTLLNKVCGNLHIITNINFRTIYLKNFQFNLNNEIITFEKL